MPEEKKTGAQKRQIKFSGLIQGGVVAPQNQAVNAEYPTSVSPNDESAVPTFGVIEAPIVETIEPTPETDTPTSDAAPKRKKAKLSLIDDSPYQPRMFYDAVEIDNLAHMMAAAGLDDAITVREKPNGRYELIKGHRRTRAARSLGWYEIDIDVVEMDDRAAKLSAMISNEGQVALTDYERGKLYREGMADGYAKNQTELGNLFGTSQALVSLRMSMLELPAIFIAMLEDNPRMFGATTAQDIRKLIKEYPGEVTLIEKAVRRINDGANETSVKAWVQQMIKPKTSPDEAIITDKAGRTIFKAKFSGRELLIQIKDAEVDAKEIEEMVLAALRQRAEAPKL